MIKKFNFNNYVKVKLTPEGIDIYYHQFDNICNLSPEFKRMLPQIDENGFTKFQLWRLMELYGPKLFSNNAFEEIYLYIDDEDLEEVKK